MKTNNINPFAPDAINYKVKKLHKAVNVDLSHFPNFHKSGSIKGMKFLFYGKGSLLVKNGNFIYNVTEDPDIYFYYSY